MLMRLLGQTAGLLVVLGATLFGAAGSWRWTQAWLFLSFMGLLSVGTGLWLTKRDPALLESRLISPFAADQARGDRGLIVLIGVGFCVWMGVMGLDRRLGWSAVPTVVETLGAVLILVGFAGVLWTFAANSFAAPQIRLQAERGQWVIDTGPYAFVRHPMYAGGALYVLGMALLLGSWWACWARACSPPRSVCPPSARRPCCAKG